MSDKPENSPAGEKAGKSPKAEALNLLEKIQRGADLALDWVERVNTEKGWIARLHDLTVGRAVQLDDRFQYLEGLHRIYISFNLAACFQLPRADGTTWLIQTDVVGNDGDPTVKIMRLRDGHILGWSNDITRLENAMLKSWWNSQEGE